MTQEVLQACLNETENQIRLGNYGSAEHMCTDILEQLEVASLAPNARVHRLLSQALWRRGQTHDAMLSAEKALALARQSDDDEELSKALQNMGHVYHALAEYSQALEYYDKALTMNEERGFTASAAVVLGNIGLLYRDLADYDRSLEYMTKALGLHEAQGRKTSAAIIRGNIGNLFYSTADYPKALEYYKKALADHEELGMKAAAANLKGNIGSAYGKLADYQKAFAFFTEALALHNEMDVSADSARVLGNIGSLYAMESYEHFDAALAEEYLLKAAQMNEELGIKGQNVMVFKSLAELFEKQQRWEAVHYFKRCIDLKDQLQNDSINKQSQQFEHRRKIEEAERDRQLKVARFQEQEKILHNILPSQIANRLIDGETTIADSYQSASVFFSDIVGFTKLSQQISAEEVVGMLNSLFTQFDKLARKHGLEKIKTIGDAYMAVSGVPLTQDNHAECAARFALAVQQYSREFVTSVGEHLELRIGLHSGPVVAGIIGENTFAYDLWGDAVNTASRMESYGVPGRIHVSSAFVNELKSTLNLDEAGIIVVERGELQVKGKGTMRTYFLEKRES